MKVVFVTNYYNHHQKPLADELYALLGDEYTFIETAPISEERLCLGYGGDERPPYIRQWYAGKEEEKACRAIIDAADVVILGCAPLATVRTRLKRGGITFSYSERVYKSGVPFPRIIGQFIKGLDRYVRFKQFYMLCASAYTPIDYARIFAFIGKTYKWGYFPEVKQYADVDALIDAKEPSSLLWVARMIDLKHPEHAVAVAKRLKAEGYCFTLRMIGNGMLEEDIRRLVAQEDLTDCVELLGAMKPEQVREHMENSEIFLFTSDRNEGWGAVLNESMNSACAVVTNSAIGAAPFLTKHGENGYLYDDRDPEDLYRKVKALLDNADDRKRMAKNAYLTMVNEWNAENAAKRFVTLCERMLAGEYKVFPFENGVCSKAPI